VNWKGGLQLSLDLIILDLLIMSLIFVPFECIFYLGRQRFLREGLATDLSHYALNDLLMGEVFVLIVWPCNWIHQNIFLNRAAAHPANAALASGPLDPGLARQSPPALPEPSPLVFGPVFLTVAL
jgi:hypothetical protein